MAIHPTAVIDPEAELDRSVEIGPYAIIEGPVRVGADTVTDPAQFEQFPPECLAGGGAHLQFEFYLLRH